MPISKTANGLLILEECDAIGDWGATPSYWMMYPPLYLSPDLSLATPGHDGIGGYFKIDYSVPCPPNNFREGGAMKNLSLQAGSRVHVWHKTVSGTYDSYAAYVCNFIYNPTLTYTIPTAGYYDHHSNWVMHTGTLPSWCTGTFPFFLSEAVIGSGGNCIVCVDRLVISTTQYVTVTSLTPGQKVAIYRSSDNTKITDATCAGGATSVSLDVDAEDYPEQMYFKIYGTDGVTLIETTTSYSVCGGDIWNWTAGQGTISITVDANIIYRSAATETPKICNITANLKTLAGANYPGATIHFSTILGTVTPSSAVTDANGNASTALTSTTHGLAVVKANWLGDATVPSCSAYYIVHVFYEAEAGDTTKNFQVYVEGVEYAYVSGRYTQNELGVVNDFEVELAAWLSTITVNGYVSIYRKGVKEFSGILKIPKRSLSNSPKVVLSGPDVSTLLNDRVVTTKIYSAKTPQYIINDLLTSFPCGIAVGSLGTCASSLTITIETETLAKAIPRICDLVNWKFRVNVNLTLDFAESFSGGTTTASFIEGTNILMLDDEKNYCAVENCIRMKGNGISSTKQDGTKIEEQGLHEAVAFNKSISDQATLDAACQAYLDSMKMETETIPAEVIDTYAPGTFGPEDYITVTSPTTGLSGTFQVRKIERDITDPNNAKLELVNRVMALWEMDQAYRRMTKDVSI